MKRIFSMIMALAMAGAIFSCKSTKTNAVKPEAKVPDTIVTASGLTCIIHKRGNGKKAVPGIQVKVHYAGRFADGRGFDSSTNRDPFKFNLGTGQVIKGWDEGIALLREGDSATLIVPPHLGYGSRGVGGVIPPNTTLHFDVKLVEAIRPDEFNITGKKKHKTPEGLEYIIVQKNKKGIPADSGQMVHVHYTGYLENGTIFDSSVPRGEPIKFTLGTGYVIKGWDIGIDLMKTGEKYRLIIPPSLGYGNSAMGPLIPANATLIFDVELVKVGL